jgi:UPF0716 protein FxsA
MNRIPWLPLLLFGVPLAELYVLIKLGGAIGALMTIVLLVFSSVLGLQLMRQQGLATAMRTQQAMARGESPSLELLESFVVFLAGAALLFPGFLTDILGFALLVPWVRRRLLIWALERMPKEPEVRVSPKGYIEGEYRRLDE